MICAPGNTIARATPHMIVFTATFSLEPGHPTPDHSRTTALACHVEGIVTVGCHSEYLSGTL
jgi:hypothetical protein